MDRNSSYSKQVQLLVQLLPLIAEEDCFALKGGTAINLFVRDLPRFSVDIDLVYLPMKDRDGALSEIREALTRISQVITKTFPSAQVVEAFLSKEDALRLVVSRNGVQVKIELSPVLRGTVFDPEVKHVCQAVEHEFGYAEIAVVNLADLYAGKICAALDRQHPRDWFDVKWFLDEEVFTDNIRKAVLVYMMSHPRPIAELLRPALKDIKQIYEGEFVNMSEKHVTLGELEHVRKFMIKKINVDLTKKERRFLLSFKNNVPEWSLLGLEGIENLPAVKWKQINLAKMPKDKHKRAYGKLAEILEDKAV